MKLNKKVECFVFAFPGCTMFAVIWEKEGMQCKAVVLQRPSRSKWVLERLPDHVRPEQLLISGSGSEPEKAAPSRVWKK
jgi:hypothetical protein